MNRKYPFLFLYVYCCLTYGQHLTHEVIGATGEDISNTSITLTNTTGELVSTTVSNGQITLTQGFQQTSQILYIEPKAFLQGALIGTSNGLMRDDLRTGNYLPAISPYNTNIKESNNAFAVSGDDAIVDWVEVKLRNSNNKVISKKSALVQRDGDIVSADGISPIQLTTQNNDYFVEVNHRNHLGAMTSSEMTLSSTPILLDFTNNTLTTFGNNARVALNSGVMALWAGNADGDNRTRYQGSNNDTNFIKDQVRFHPNNPSNSNFFVYFDYSNADINMDGRIRYQGSNNDTNIIKDIIRSHPNNPALSNFFLILEQTPN